MTLVRVDGQNVDVIDSDCPFRPCYRFGFDKGPFTTGVGYTRPETPWRAVCLTRHLHGCPTIGVHLQCSHCHELSGPAVLRRDDEPLPATPEACPLCGSDDLYWLADVHEPPSLCCEAPSLPPRPPRYSSSRQRCRSCGTWLKGERLALARLARGET